MPPRRINEIVLGKRAVSADTALRLARFFGTSDRFWLNLQAAYDLDVHLPRVARFCEALPMIGDRRARLPRARHGHSPEVWRTKI